MLTYCKTCVMPNSRPNINFNSEGICSGCVLAKEKKEEIDWKAREKEFVAILDKHRNNDPRQWDCIVPVSGGKDSTYQIHVLKNVYKMNPLAVTFRTDARTPLGEHNITKLREMGVDHIDITPNPVGFNKLRKKAFEEEGDCSLADHLAIYSVIPQVALKYRIALVIWGEEPNMEYGGAKSFKEKAALNRAWCKSQHILKGKLAEDWADESLPISELRTLIYPPEEELDALGYTPIFLGTYIPWDAKQNVEIAKQYGFKTRERPVMGLYDYADIDCEHIVIHHYFKWLKFGFNRITDNACNEIRKGRLTRNEAILLVKEKDGIKPPKEYIANFCKRIGISEKHFWEIAEQYRNHDIWKKTDKGEWYIEGWIGGDKTPDKFPYEPLTRDDIWPEVLQ